MIKTITKAEFKERLPLYLEDHLAFIEDFGRIRTGRGIIPFEPFDYQRELVRSFQKYDFNIILKARQLGISTIAGAYIGTYIIFHPHSDIVIIAINEVVAKEMVLKIKIFLTELPDRVKPKILNPNNKESINLENGSRVMALTSTKNSGRSFTGSFLVIDECVKEDTLIKVRNTKTNFVKKIEIKKLLKFIDIRKSYDKDYFVINNYEVYSENGWCKFDGIKLTKKSKYYKLLFSDDSILECSGNHRIKLANGEFEYAKDIELGTKVFNLLTLRNKEVIEDNILLYDLINVENGNTYYTNNVISHNCAFVDNADELYTSAYPMLSNGGRCILLSTPNGTNNLFYRLYDQAVNDTEAQFHATTIYWWDMPGRDDKWKKRIMGGLGGDEKKFNQEYECSFNVIQRSVVNTDAVNRLLKINKNYIPILNFKTINGINYDDKLEVYKEPVKDHVYLLTADTSEGVGQNGDSNSILIWDLTEDEIIGEYDNNYINEKNFAKVLFELGMTFNEAHILLELRSTGKTVANQLLEDKYKNVLWTDRKMSLFLDPDEALKDIYDNTNDSYVPGIITSSASKIMMVGEMRNAIENNEFIKIYPRKVLEQVKNYINASNGQKPLYRAFGIGHDDLVICFMIGLFVKKYIWSMIGNNNKLTEAILNSIRRDNVSMANSEALSDLSKFAPIYNTRKIKMLDPYQDKLIGDLRCFLK